MQVTVYQEIIGMSVITYASEILLNDVMHLYFHNYYPNQIKFLETKDITLKTRMIFSSGMRTFT